MAMSAEEVARYVAEQLRPMTEQLDKARRDNRQLLAQNDAMANRVVTLEESTQALRRTAEELQGAMGAIGRENASLVERMRVLDDTHRRYHTTVDEMTVAVEKLQEAVKRLEEAAKNAASAPPGEGRRRRLLDTKHMVPVPLGDDYKEKWRTWCKKAKKVLGRLDTSQPKRLKSMLEELEKQSEPLTDEQNAKMAYLTLRTSRTLRISSKMP